MNKPGKYVIAALVLYMAFSGYAELAKQDDKSRESYAVIIQRNIFSKDRSTHEPASVDRRPSDPNAVGDPNAVDVAFVYVLRGVAIDSKNKIAFIENQSSGEFFQAIAGEFVDGMKIKEIKADRVVFDKDQSEVEIMVGMDLSGLMPGAPVDTAASGSSGFSGSSSFDSGDGDSPPPIQSADEAEILKQMLERRKQQVGN